MQVSSSRLQNRTFDHALRKTVSTQEIPYLLDFVTPFLVIFPSPKFWQCSGSPVYMYLHKFQHAYTYIYICIRTYTYIYMYLYMYIYNHTHKSTHTHAHTDTCTYTYIYMYIYTYVRICGCIDNYKSLPSFTSSSLGKARLARIPRPQLNHVYVHIYIYI